VVAGHEETTGSAVTTHWADTGAGAEATLGTLEATTGLVEGN